MLHKFDVVIPCKSIDNLTIKCIDTIFALYPSLKITVLPDEFTGFSGSNNFKCHPTGKVTIASKRNIAAKLSDSEFLVFIDSDAYPAAGWLEHAYDYFSKSNVAAVGGPNLPPPNQPYQENIVGNSLQSFLVSGLTTYRKRKSSAKFVNDLPSCNLIVRRSIYLGLGGMKEELFTGEDVDFCIRLRNDNLLIAYDPNVLVFHKNRDFWNFILQRLTYGASVPEILNSSELIKSFYFLLPALFLLFIITTPLLIIISPSLKLPYLSIIAIYLLMVIFESMRNSKSIKEFFGTTATIALGNLTPGLGTILAFLNLMPDRYIIYKNN